MLSENIKLSIKILRSWKQKKKEKVQKNIFKGKKGKSLKKKLIREGQGIIEDRNYNTLHLLTKKGNGRGV